MCSRFRKIGFYNSTNMCIFKIIMNFFALDFSWTSFQTALNDFNKRIIINILTSNLLELRFESITLVEGSR